MDMFVRDDRGLKHDQIHGVTVKEWFLRWMRLAREELNCGDDMRRITTNQLCEDPDCCRLNRLAANRLRQAPVQATFAIARELPPVLACDKNDVIGPGHPFKLGSRLCYNCALMGTTKRLIDAEQKIKTGGTS